MDWAGLRAYLPDVRDYGNVTLLALRIQATSNISGMAARRVNVIATRKTRTWTTGGGWAAVSANSSIAWAFADAATSTEYGGGLADSRVDLAALEALDTIWTARGDYFNGRFDSLTTVMDALTRIAAAGRAKPYMQGGVLRIFRDATATVPSALFSMRNIVKGTFAIEYVMPTTDSANYCDTGYWDADTWSAKRVDGVPPGITPTTPAKIETFGITDRDHAGREGAYFAAASLYRRKIISFTAEMAGYLPALGDLIAIQHDMPAWGQHGEIVAWNAGTLTATLSDPPVWLPATTHYVGMRTRQGALSGPWVVTQSGTHGIVFALTPDITPYTTLDAVRTHILFGPSDLWRQAARVTSIKPQSLTRVHIECVNEDARVHAADVGLIVAAPELSSLAVVLDAPVVTGLVARASLDNPNLVNLTWLPAAGAEYYLVEQSRNGGVWERVAEPRGTTLSVLTVHGDNTTLRVAAVGLTVGPWSSVAFNSYSDLIWTDDNALIWTGDNYKIWGIRNSVI